MLSLTEEARSSAELLEESDAVRMELTGRVVDLKTEVGKGSVFLRVFCWFSSLFVALFL